MLNVVLADDEPLVLEGLRTMVDWQRFGFQVIGEALNGPEALKLIREKRPNLVLTDINMPVLNGLELIAELNASMAEPPRFVILSGYDDFGYAKAALRQRVVQYLLKPIDDEEIAELLSRLRVIIQSEIASKEQAVQKQALVAGSLFNRLIHGEYSPQLETAAAELLDIRADTELIFVLIGESASLSALQERAGLYFPSGTARALQDHAGRNGILLQSAGLSAEALDTALIHLQRGLADMLREPAVLAVSSRMNGAGALPALYAQTLEAWKVGCSRDKSAVIYCGSPGKPGKGLEECLQAGHFSDLLEKVRRGDTGEISSCVHSSFAGLAEQGLAAEHVQSAVADLEMSFCHWTAEHNGDPGRVMSELRAQYGGLGELGNYAELSRYVLELCLLTAAYLAELRRANEGNTIFNVIQYVDQEFRNKLQLQDLARQFHMNAAYLGQLFRKETGRSFSEYLNEKRIEAAKGLLKRTNLKIADIALQVGFANTDYFIDKFKATVGVVPSVYKNGSSSKSL